MDEFIQALEECMNPDYALYYEDRQKQAEYLLSVAWDYYNK